MMMKTFARDLIAKRHQVPAKYWYGRLRGGLEPEMSLLSVLVKAGDHVIDVGGNRGVYAYALSRLGCLVEVFEPNPKCCDVLRAWATHLPTVHIHSVGLSRANGHATLHIPRDTSGLEHDASASIEHGARGPTRDEEIETRTLDSYAFQDAVLIKIDVEGHELGVLEGANVTLGDSQPALLIEIEQRHNKSPISQIFDWIHGRGYDGYFLSGGRITPIHEFRVDSDQSMSAFGSEGARYINNFLFLHRDRIQAPRYAALRALLP